MRILIVEDNLTIATQLAEYLRSSGFVSHIEQDGDTGYFEGMEGEYDAILLDIGLPGMDGFSILEKWREAGNKIPVIMMTARHSKMDVIRGLELGADDYITKPFDLEEVVARIQANIKRESGTLCHLIKAGNVVLDLRSNRMLVNGLYTKLTRIEFLITRYLFMHQGTVISATQLAEHTYEDFDNDSGIIARHIANIRQKIGHQVIVTEANRGYYVPSDQET